MLTKTIRSQFVHEVGEMVEGYVILEKHTVIPPTPPARRHGVYDYQSAASESHPFTRKLRSLAICRPILPNSVPLSRRWWACPSTWLPALPPPSVSRNGRFRRIR